MSDFFLDQLNHYIDQTFSGNWAKFSRKIGVPASTIGSIKDGADPRFSTIRRICDAEGLSVDWLLTGEGQMYRSADTTRSITLPTDETDLLDAYRAADDETKTAIRVLVRNLTGTAKSR